MNDLRPRECRSAEPLMSFERMCLKRREEMCSFIQKNILFEGVVLLQISTVALRLVNIEYSDTTSSA